MTATIDSNIISITVNNTVEDINDTPKRKADQGYQGLLGWDLE